MTQEVQKRRPGRPKGSVKPVDQVSVEVSVTLSPMERDLLKELGGSKWIRAKLAEVQDERSDNEVDAILNEAHLRARRKELAIKRAMEQRRVLGQPKREGRTFPAICLNCDQDFQAPTRVSALCPQCEIAKKENES